MSVILLRHGQSQWNKAHRFTGWTDVELTDEGRSQARQAGQLLLESCLTFDVAYTSLLSRAIETLNLVLEETRCTWIPVHKTWHLNERHYGALEGMSKVEMVTAYGRDQVNSWRRGYDCRPPEMTNQDPRYPGHDPRYSGLLATDIPASESLRDTYDRVSMYWRADITPMLQHGRNVLVVAHGNTIRALLKHLMRISDAEIVTINIPTALPIVIELNEHLLGRLPYRFLGGDGLLRQRLAETATLEHENGLFRADSDL